MNASYSHFYLRRLWYAWAAALAAIPLFYIGYHPVANVQHGPTRTSWVWLDAATAERMPTHENQFSGWVHIPDSGVIWLQNSIGAEVTLTIDGRVVYQGQQSQEITLDGSVPDPAAFRLSYALPDDFPVRGILSLSRKNVLGGKQPIPAWDYGRQSTTSLQARLYAGARWLALVAGALALLLAAASLRLSRRQRFLLGSIFILSLVVRLVSLAQKFDNDPTLWTMETVWDNYVLMGRSWLAGIVHVGGTIYQQGAFIYLGLAQMALGPDISHLYILNTVLGSFAPVLLTLAGWALIDRKTGMIAGLLSALFAPP